MNEEHLVAVHDCQSYKITMGNKLSGKDLIKLGFPKNNSINIALGQINRYRKKEKKESILTEAIEVLLSPEKFKGHGTWGKVAEGLVNPVQVKFNQLKTTRAPFSIFGENEIDEQAKFQLYDALKLPIAVKGALMPDAHSGYGLPIGGVLATDNAVIPYGVGVDIGCRMALSVFDLPDSYIAAHHDKLKKVLMDNTRFGAGNGYQRHERVDHPVLDNELFKTHGFIRSLKDEAWTPLGSSGGGNHFVEFGIIEFAAGDDALGVGRGQYLALLTHSGSRGLGATIAGHYTKLAKEICKLPYEAQNLAYLDLNTAEGQEYWLAMNLAGDYASACHEVIHDKIRTALGAGLLAKVENHHNFAWKEQFDGEEVIVHRKGATPASRGTMGIIPGSMATPGFLVRGKGEEASINSASHGAGRLMSRTQAIKTLSPTALKTMLSDYGITLLGAGMDEAPMAYKDIHTV